MTLLIIGATGTLGRQIARRALNNGYNVRCLVRDVREARFLCNWGAEIIYGDLTAPETLPESFKNITAVIDASTSRSKDSLNLKSIDWDGKLALLQAAKVANVKRFIFFSVLAANKNKYIPLMRMKSEFEMVVQDSGVPYTIFQLSGFFQGLIRQYALPILEQYSIFYTAQDSLPFSYMDTEDVTIFCLKSLDLKSAENKTFALVNPNTILSSKLIEMCENLSGQKAGSSRIFLSEIKVLRKFASFFQWTWNIADRLSFIELFLDPGDFNSNYKIIQEIFHIYPNDLLSIENYFQEYFERVVGKLNNLNYNKKESIKRRDLTF